jgi:hypothetical protein
VPTLTSRRAALAVLAGGAGLAACQPAAKEAPAAPAEWDLADKAQAFRAKVKIKGSLAKETVHGFMRLNIYGDDHTGNFKPLFVLNNLIIDVWEPGENGAHTMKKYEAGYYSAFDGYEPITEWENPWTGKKLEVFNFLLGPIFREYAADGVQAMAFVPVDQPLERIGDRIFLASHSIEKLPNIIDPKTFPLESSGPNIFLNSMMTFSALARDVFDPALNSAPCHMQLQNKANWAPWMKMGQRPGGTVGRGFGAKISGIDALRPEVRKGFEATTPKILDLANWGEETHMEGRDYLVHLEAQKKAK